MCFCPVLYVAYYVMLCLCRCVCKHPCAVCRHSCTDRRTDLSPSIIHIYIHVYVCVYPCRALTASPCHVQLQRRGLLPMIAGADSDGPPGTGPAIDSDGTWNPKECLAPSIRAGWPLSIPDDDGPPGTGPAQGRRSPLRDWADRLGPPKNGDSHERGRYRVSDSGPSARGPDPPGRLREGAAGAAPGPPRNLR